ncbi:MAG TPA: primosomal protein N', partial [Sinorhizobium sp.]|nr:primosomal protein N' [Sinorhizobium sp.]
MTLDSTDLFGAVLDRRVVPVLVPMPAPKAYSYVVPDGVAVEPGSIVQVPLGPRLVVGVVWDGPDDGTVDPKKLKRIEKVFDCPPLTRDMRAFLDWVAAYTVTPPGLVARMALRAPTAFDPEPMVEALRLTDMRPERMTAARERVIAAAS